MQEQRHLHYCENVGCWQQIDVDKIDWPTNDAFFETLKSKLCLIQNSYPSAYLQPGEKPYVIKSTSTVFIRCHSKQTSVTTTVLMIAARHHLFSSSIDINTDELKKFNLEMLAGVEMNLTNVGADEIEIWEGRENVLLCDNCRPSKVNQ